MFFAVGFFLDSLGTGASTSAENKPRAGAEPGFAPHTVFPFTLKLETSHDIVP